MPFGAIIGKVTVGEIVSTEHWVEERKRFEDGAAESVYEEMQFGDYSANRYAWHFPTFELFEKPIPCKGALSLWDFDLSTGKRIEKKKKKSNILF